MNLIGCLLVGRFPTTNRRARVEIRANRNGLCLSHGRAGDDGCEHEFDGQ
jgi:hypothetical protein